MNVLLIKFNDELPVTQHRPRKLCRHPRQLSRCSQQLSRRTHQRCRRPRKFSRLLFLFGGLALLLTTAASKAQQTTTIAQPAPQSSATTNRLPLPVTQQATGKATTTEQRTGSITGRILTDDGHPLANALAYIFPIGGTGPQTGVATDAEGRFQAIDLRPGVYAVGAVAPGYVLLPDAGAEFGLRRFYRVGDYVQLTLVKGGVITGVVTDADGAPVVAARTRAVRVRKPSERGTAAPGFSRDSMTDDRGVYRLYGLEPGVYVLSVGGSTQIYGSPNAYDDDAPTYYPSATRDTASELTLHAGEELTGIDVRYRGEDGHVISGFVFGITPDGGSRFSGGISISLLNAASGAIEAFTYVGEMNNNRSFALGGIADGVYQLTAVRNSGNTAELTTAMRKITVRGGDVAGVELKLESLGSLSGNVVLEPPPKAECRSGRASTVEEIFIAARRDEKEKEDEAALSSFFFGRMPAAPNNKGEFKALNLRDGGHRLDVQLPDDDWFVRSITMPALVAPPSAVAAARSKPPMSAAGAFTLKPGERIGGVTINIGQGAAILRGRVAPAAAGFALPRRLRVHLVPVEPERASDVLRYAEAMVEADGQFALSRLAPGSYWLMARVDSVGEGESAGRRPVALDAGERGVLRREAEKAGFKVELQPCQRLADYVLHYAATPPKQPPVK